MRRFYGHGDRRMEMPHRRAELHEVMAHHDGRLPDHPIRRPRPGMSPARIGAVNHPLPAAHPGMAPVTRVSAVKKTTPTNEKKHA
jgi:hypothetical protein